MQIRIPNHVCGNNYFNKEEKDILRSSYLIQRLRLPFEKKNFSEDKWLFRSFRFGGCSDRLGYFTKEFALRIGEVCAFEGMGASQFEWGVVPRAFENYRKNIEDYISFEMDIPNFKNKVYVICKKKHSRSIRYRIKALAKYEDWHCLKKHRGLRPRERVGLNNSLIELERGLNPETVGWIELDNTFFFFVKKEMWDNYNNLFKTSSMRFIVED